jgi:hypothetical protein
MVAASGTSGSSGFASVRSEEMESSTAARGRESMGTVEKQRGAGSNGEEK